MVTCFLILPLSYVEAFWLSWPTEIVRAWTCTSASRALQKAAIPPTGLLWLQPSQLAHDKKSDLEFCQYTFLPRYNIHIVNICLLSPTCMLTNYSIWAPSSEFVSSSIPSWQILTAHAQPFREARDLAFCLKVPLDSLLVWASSEGSGETARICAGSPEPSLLA